MKIIIDCTKNSCVFKIIDNKYINEIDKESVIYYLKSSEIYQIFYKNSKKIIMCHNDITFVIKGNLNDKDIINIIKNKKIKRIILKCVNKQKIAAILGTAIISFSIIPVSIVTANVKVGELEKNIVYPKKEYIPIKTNQDFFIETYDLDLRLEQSKKIKNQENTDLAKKLTPYVLNIMLNFINSDEGKQMFALCDSYGVDPYLMLALFMTESNLDHESLCPGGEYYNGFAIGIGQLEQPNGKKVKAFNYDYNDNVIVVESEKNALNVYKNMEITIMHMQKLLHKYKGNIKLALQAYNYGEGLVDLIIKLYADEKNFKTKEVIENIKDDGWIKHVYDVHENPVSFSEALDGETYSDYSPVINFLKNWKYGYYGNPEYIERVFGYYIGIHSKNIINGENAITNLSNNNRYFRKIIEHTK